MALRCLPAVYWRALEPLWGARTGRSEPTLLWSPGFLPPRVAFTCHPPLWERPISMGRSSLTWQEIVHLKFSSSYFATGVLDITKIFALSFCLVKSSLCYFGINQKMRWHQAKILCFCRKSLSDFLFQWLQRCNWQTRGALLSWIKSLELLRSLKVL